jgi:hypothetical protein
MAGRAWLHVGTNDAVEIMPVQTLVILSVSPGPTQLRELQKLRGIGLFLPSTDADLRSAADALFREIDVDRDILSWVGLEAAAGLVNNTERPVASGGSPELLLAIATRNKAKSQAFLDRMRIEIESEEVALRDAVYQNVPLVYQDPEGLAYAQFKGFVVVGSSREVSGHRHGVWAQILAGQDYFLSAGNA